MSNVYFIIHCHKLNKIFEELVSLNYEYNSERRCVKMDLEQNYMFPYNHRSLNSGFFSVKIYNRQTRSFVCTLPDNY